MSTRAYAIVGSGIAALSACEAIRGSDHSAQIRLYSPEPRLFYSRPGLAYFAARMLPEPTLAIRTAREVAELNIEHHRALVTSVDPAAHELIADGTRARYDRLLLATGAESVPLAVPGADLEGVLRMDGIADAREFRKRAGWTDEAVVIGGGSTAVEMAEALRTHGVRTHYLLRGERYWSRVFDREESELVQAGLLRHGIQLHFQTEVAEIVARRGAVAGVRTSTGTVIPAQIVVGAVGVRPRIELAQQSGIATNKGVLADEYLATSAPDVFVAGDAAQVTDPDTGRAELDTLWHSALDQGRAAGLNMTGIRTSYRKAVALNVTRLGGITVAIIGNVGSATDPDIVTLTRGQSERWRSDPNAWTLTRNRLADRIRVLVCGSIIVGAVVIGDQQYTRSLIRAIATRTSISGLDAQARSRPDTALDALLEALP